MTIPIALPDTLRDFLEDQMKQRHLASLDACATYLLELVEQMVPRRQTWKVNGQTYSLTRLTDSLDDELSDRSIGIKPAVGTQIYLSGLGQLNLAEMYAVCRYLFGERGRGFDDWKGGFVFPLALDVPRATRSPAYLLRLKNYRGSVCCDLLKIVERDDKRLENPIYYPPDQAEFPWEEIEYFTDFLYGYLTGFFEWVKTCWDEPFLLVVQSNLILYGFDGTKFFTEQFESPSRFEKARRKLAERLPSPGFYPAAPGIERLIW